MELLKVRRLPLRRVGASSRHFRRVLYGLLGVVVSAYVVLFVLVVSRHVDQGAQAELRGAVVALQQQPSRSAMEGRRQQQQLLRRSRAFACAIPKFLKPPGPVVALASFPGSGNTWIRFLVQQATGYLTGSVYRDYSLKHNGFPAESVSDGSVLLVKTHEWGEGTRTAFQRAVLLVRDPSAALLAEFNRRAGGHIGHAAPHKFTKGDAWSNFVLTHSRLWMESVLDWLQFEGPLLVLRYEQVASDLPGQLARLLDFLEQRPANHTDCVLRNRDGIFRRPRKPLRFDPFERGGLRGVVEGHRRVVEDALRHRTNDSSMPVTHVDGAS